MFFVFQDSYVLCIYVMNILCTFRISILMYGYVTYLMKENGFSLKKEKQKIPTEIIMNADYADNIALLAKTPTQAESLLHGLEHAAGGIGPHVNAEKTEYVYFNQKVDISTLNGGSLKSVDKFMNLRISISSTENDINMKLVKA